MPQLSSIVLNDGIAPVTFTGENVLAGVGFLADKSDGSPQLSATLVISNTKGSTGHRFKAKVTAPVTGDVNGVTTVLDNVIANLDIRLPNKSFAADRTAFRITLSNLLLDAIVVAMIDNVEGIY